MLNWIVEIEPIIYIKMDLAWNNLQGLICHKTQQTKPINYDINYINRIWLIGANSVMIIVVENELSKPGSNSGQGYLHFT